MGCISSKAITRSMSIREELSHGLQSRSAVWEELLTSHSANDQLFGFVCSSNVGATKLKTSSFNAKPGSDDSSKFTRSRSCHTVLSENMLGSNEKSVAGSRSFHTVEEYDALLERIRRTRSLDCFEDCFPWDDDAAAAAADDDGVKLQASRCSTEEENDAISHGTGWKKKAVARGLKSLDVSGPGPGIARSKQRMVVQGQIYSPGTYITPKFGSYNAPATAMAEDKNDAFSPELVAALEDCMQQLQVEEDAILRHMDERSST